MIYVLVGKTCCGKSTIMKDLSSIGKKQVITYTTRPIRPGEVDGKDYKFITEDEYKKLDKENLLAAKNSFVSSSGEEWFYAIDVNDLSAGEDLIAITEPNGLRKLKNEIEEDQVRSIYYDIPFDERLRRGVEMGKDIEEHKRRMKSDEIDFEGFEEEADFIITNIDYEEALNETLRIVDDI